MIHLPRRTLGSVLAAALVALVARPAAAYDALYSFGDSLSDVGNVQAVTAGIPFVPTTPGPSYFNGRFSNGLNFIDDLSVSLGVGPAVNSLAGGTVYAYGGARTTGTTGLPALVVRDVDQQVTTYLGANPLADANGLYVVFAGANDVAAKINDTPSLNLTAAAGSLAQQVGRLYDAGARQVLVPNLPSLGLVPQYNGTAASATQASGFSDQFNAALAAALDGVELTRPDLTLFRLDTAALFDSLTTNPTAFGFTNATNPAAPGLSPGDQNYDASLIVANPDNYVFWDTLHPTRTGHAALAAAALAAIPEPTTLGLIVLAAPLALRRRRGTAA